MNKNPLKKYYRKSTPTQIIPGSLLVIVLLMCCQRNGTSLSTDQLYSARTTLDERQKFYADVTTRTIERALQKNLHDSTESHWKGAFWAMGLTQYRSAQTDKAIEQAVEQFEERSIDFQRALLEVIYQLYPVTFTPAMETIIKRTGNPKIFAMGVNYLLRNKPARSADDFMELMHRQFPDWPQQPILLQLYRQLENVSGQTKWKQPPLVDLFAHPFARGQVVLFSLQRRNRDYPGLTILRDGKGKFWRNHDGNLWSIPHLARSASNLPGYLTNGNTPQGIYRIIGTDQSSNVFIGPTTNLQLRLPFEVSVETFFGPAHAGDTLWSEERYSKLLPESWRKYSPIYDAYHAGKAGRNEIIAHGTTINPAYYSDRIFYPFTPSLGCLTAMELWDANSGQCKYSDQVALINAYRSAGAGPGYFILIELDDQEAPVTLVDILDDLYRAERINP